MVFSEIEVFSEIYMKIEYTEMPLEYLFFRILNKNLGKQICKCFQTDP